MSRAALEYAQHSWQGFSTGEWDGDMLKVTTTHLKEVWVRRNGLPRSDVANLRGRASGQYFPNRSFRPEPLPRRSRERHGRAGEAHAFGHCYDRGDFIEPANQRWRDAYLSVCKDKRADEARIANLTDSADCEGHWLRAAIRPDGTFTITNGRTGYATTYAAR